MSQPKLREWNQRQKKHLGLQPEIRISQNPIVGIDRLCIGVAKERADGYRYFIFQERNVLGIKGRPIPDDETPFSCMGIAERFILFKNIFEVHSYLSMSFIALYRAFPIDWKGLCSIFNDSRRNASGYSIRRYILRYDCVCSDDSSVADMNIS